MSSDKHEKTDVKVGLYEQIMKAEPTLLDASDDLVSVSYSGGPISVKDWYSIDRSERFIHYISDIHLDHKIIDELRKRHGDRSIKSYISKVVQKMYSEDYKNDILGNRRSLLLIAGDISHTKSVNELFLSQIKEYYGDWSILYVLGNHELWGTHLDNPSIKQIYSDYDSLCRNNGIVMLDCALYTINANKHILINYDNICSASDSELREFLIKSEIIVLGGTAYAKNNSEFNANNNIYRGTITRDEEIEYSTQFNDLYERLLKIAHDLPMIVLTHMPKCDWGDDNYNPNWIYVSGHTHNNVSILTDDVTLYSDNQIGYLNRGVYLKRFLMGCVCDIFRDYQDGIHEISTEAYRSFYAGIKKPISMNRPGQIMMLKRSGLYLFIFKNKNDECLILNGGALSKGNYYVEHYYDKMPIYRNNLERELRRYQERLESISEVVKKIGGSGTIHGCIVDITFNSHIYLNPLDLTVTPYYAVDMVEKYVFRSLRSLLFEHCPLIYNNMADSSILPDTWDCNVTEDGAYYQSTDIYRMSRIMRGYQYALSNGIIRRWNDSLVNEDDDSRILCSLVGSE